ncbi:glutamate--cysteine ligase [Euzebya sp.]|uniref:glutamate--cysteine ligase n=1 Tax=Euzebya sp. TaxID=1971409 RepID=UPI0035185960
MGRDIESIEFTREDRRRYREKVKVCLQVLRQLMDEGRFSTGQRTLGVELEIYLTDDHAQVLPVNAEVLDALASPEFQTELAQFNMEFATSPRAVVGDCFTHVEDELRQSLDRANEKARDVDARVIMIGILPTLTDFDVTEQNLSANPRYKALNDAILNARGEDLVIDIAGDENLSAVTNSIVFEAACTSMQLHLQVDPGDFARYWNAAQALSGPLVAVAANSPFFLGKRLHHETRIALFQQAIDTRTEELAEQGVRPRVWFGERWLTDGVFELFEENVRYFPSLLPITESTDPEGMLVDGQLPALEELTLHNGTIYRWNRPVYDIAGGEPHLRIENRVLPAGPTVIDCTANIALYYGLLGGLAEASAPVWEAMSFQAAESNFFEAARYGMGSRLYWPGLGTLPAAELMVRHLLPLARKGLEEWGVDAADIDRYLGTIEQRALSGQNGAAWQIAAHERLLAEGMDRAEAAITLTTRYADLHESGVPVHQWPVVA